MIDIKIVKMEEKHIPSVAEIEKMCFSMPWSEASLAGELRNPLAKYLVAEYNSQVVGYIGANCILGEVDINNIAVSPEYRRCSIGQRLLESFINECFSEGADLITLEVRESNIPAISLYSKFGFERVGLRKNYYIKPTENAVLMTLFKPSLNS